MYKERQIWRWVSEFKKFETMLSKYWVTENCYITEYAKHSDYEDFAEVYSSLYKIDNKKTHCYIKAQVVTYFFDKYEWK